MKTREFIAALDHARIRAAIAAAEWESTGQLRVFVTHKTVSDTLAAARKRFSVLGMQKTHARNAILIFFAPRSHQYAIVGDEGIHQKCGGDEFWQTVVGATMGPLLKQGLYTEAIVAAIASVGRELAEHFPRAAGQAQENELPDDIAED
jgi:uncharacterized membrane protein